MARSKTPEGPHRPPRPSSARISATEAARNFSDLVNRVLYHKDVFVIERGRRAVCEIRPVYGVEPFTVGDLVEMLRTLPSPGEEFLDHVERAASGQPAAESTRWRRS